MAEESVDDGCGDSQEIAGNGKLQSLQKTLKEKSGSKPENISEVLSKISEKRPEKITEMMAMMGGSMGNPLHNKMNEEHITQVLELAKLHDEREFELHKGVQGNNDRQATSTRRYSFASFIAIIFILLVILILFKDKPDVLIPLLSGVGGLLTGALGGYGFGKSKE